MDLKLFIEQTKKLFNTMTRSQKITLFSSTGVLLAGIIFILIISSQINYVPLFTNLNQKDASSIITYLEQKKIDYKLINGTTIDVPKDKVYKLRLDLAAAGLPRGGSVGFEIFDKQSFGTTNFVENINYIRALEGELTRTIESIAEIKNAKINLAIPRPTIFAEEQTPPTASIVVDLYGSLPKRQIIAIQKLVAAGVPKLTYKNVTIVDSRGNLLSRNENDEELLTANELKYKQIIEKKYDENIEKLLIPILGKSKFAVTVNVDVDLSKIKKKSIAYDPNSVVVSEQNEESTSASPSSGGVPGVISNVGNNTSSVRNQSKNSNSKSTTNYNVGSTVTTISEPLIKINKISAAVIIDGIYEPVKNKKGKIVKYNFKPRDPKTIQLIQEAVMRAVGYNKKRGDQISVSTMAFSDNNKQPKSGGAINTHNLILSAANYYKYIIIALLLFIFYFLFLRKFIKNVASVKTPEDKRTGYAAGKTSEEEAVRGKTVKEIENEISTKLDREENVSEETIKNKVMEDKIKEAADSNPEEVASLVKTLLSTKNK